ncbi:unnamed protein product [Cylicostephanus goldi]|uniref:Uncharacterized protein n=1 Tax=Cylicostephanus goldi TaxID=71465 RepID=A0A3P7MDA7_CYLGO|nr:unnamed protein product [Cylicostephanus goldi]
METRDDGKEMPWSPDTKPRMGPRGMEPGMGDRRQQFGGEDPINGRHGPRGGDRSSGSHKFGGENRFNGTHRPRGGDSFSGSHGFGGEDRNGEMMERPMRG